MNIILRAYFFLILIALGVSCTAPEWQKFDYTQAELILNDPFIKDSLLYYDGEGITIRVTADSVKHFDHKKDFDSLYPHSKQLNKLNHLMVSEGVLLIAASKEKQAFLLRMDLEKKTSSQVGFIYLVSSDQYFDRKFNSAFPTNQPTRIKKVRNRWFLWTDYIYETSVFTELLTGG